MAVEHVRLTRQMIGTRTPDLVKFPEVDVRGKEYSRGEVSMRNVGPHQFVVIPSTLDGADKWDIDNPYADVDVDVLTTLEGDELAAHVASLVRPSPVVDEPTPGASPVDTDLSSFGGMSFDAPIDETSMKKRR